MFIRIFNSETKMNNKKDVLKRIEVKLKERFKTEEYLIDSLELYKSIADKSSIQLKAYEYLKVSVSRILSERAEIKSEMIMSELNKKFNKFLIKID